jgi:subtilisin family serine protease
MDIQQSTRRGSRLPRLAAAALAVCGLAAAALLPAARPAAGARGGGPLFMPGEVLVHFKDGVSDAVKGDAFNRAGVNFREQIHTRAMRAAGRAGLDRVFTRGAITDAIRSLAASGAVAYAEPNWVYTHQAVSNDPYFTQGTLWGMFSPSGNPYGSNAATAWSNGYTGSSSVCVGIVDQGIQYTHPDLAANIWNNPGESPDGLDNDGNGYVDDFHGWDFLHGDNQIYSAADGDTHGTHVAGTIGAVGGNGLGVAGVNWSLSMISCKFIGPSGGNTADAVKALDYLSDLKANHGRNIVAVNNSWGGGGYSQTLHDAIIRAANQNILFVAAAGNNASDNTIYANYPSNYDASVGTSTQPAAGYNNVIAVAALDTTGALAYFSDWGATNVHLGAPGVSIASTVPTDSYASYSGTSMATPHVTGAAALYASMHPSATAAEIRSAILASAAPTASLAGKTTTGGRLDIGALMAGTTSAPPAPAPTPSPAPAPAPVPAPAQAPLVTGVSPYQMGSGTSVRVTVYGQYFQPGARISFSGGSGAQPAAAGVSVASTSQSLTGVVSCARNGNTRNYRWWNLTVTNPDGKSSTLYASFAVK